MNVTQIEANIKQLLREFNRESFIYDFLSAYGLPKASIARLKKGNLNLSKNDGEILWKKKLYFKPVSNSHLYQTIEDIKNNPESIKNDPRFVIVTDYQKLLAIDTKTRDSLDIEISDLNTHFDFFLPWSGVEKASYRGDNPADRKAAYKMATFFDEIKKDNPDLTSREQLHGLNLFLSRLLFCFFAENTGIFEKKIFTNSIATYTQADGSNLHEYLDNIFAIMNQEIRDNVPEYISKFPYVNGGLFRDSHPVPKFSSKSRRLLLENGDLDWSSINPDIFGSMMQGVVDANQRASLGMHYTSVPNIMKVIEPLFLNDLKDEFTKQSENKSKLQELINRIGAIKVFDPACGSGNFLIIAYKELRQLEIEIISRIEEITGQSSLAFSQIHLSNFYGIEIDDFAHEIAKLSLWLAKHQIDMVFEEKFGRALPPLPLKDAGNIVCANACRIDWELVCPKGADDEIYILGNPPYLGQRNQKQIHLDDMSIVFNGSESYKNLDYISCWFVKSSEYTRSEKINYAFVSTSSICQGRHIGLLWPKIYKYDLEIFFAHQSFKWVNNAKHNAGVSCVIVGIGKKSKRNKYIFTNNSKKMVDEINSYLSARKVALVESRRVPISKLPFMIGGNQPREGGHLTLSDEEKKSLINDNPDASKFIREFIGTNELLQSIRRWCIWVADNEVDEANRIPEIKRRINLVYEKRKNGNSLERNFSHMPHRFVQINTANIIQIVIPNISTDRRRYIPVGFLSADVIVSNLAMVIPDGDAFAFGVVHSAMHFLWTRTVAGRLGDAIRYTVGLCYNTFPFPDIIDDQKKRIEMYALAVLDEREKHSEKTLAQLYDPDKMPEGLRQAHNNLDRAIELCYRNKPFESDEERLEHLFTLYEKMLCEKSINHER